MDQDQRRDDDRDQPRVRVPERRDAHAERGEDELRRQALERRRGRSRCRRCPFARWNICASSAWLTKTKTKHAARPATAMRAFVVVDDRPVVEDEPVHAERGEDRERVVGDVERARCTTAGASSATPERAGRRRRAPRAAERAGAPPAGGRRRSCGTRACLRCFCPRRGVTTTKSCAMAAHDAQIDEGDPAVRRRREPSQERRRRPRRRPLATIR